jgi:hypothetical protein
VTGNNAFLWVTEEGVISIAMISNMDKINILGKKRQPNWKE